MTEGSTLLAHGVGRTFESPIPLYLYLAAAGGTVAVSFLIRALRPEGPARAEERRVAGPGVATALRRVLQVTGILGLVLALAAGVVGHSEGFTLTTLFFWVGLVVGTTLASAVVAQTWEASDPLTTLEGVYRLEDATVRARSLPWWIAPAGLYLLFWFELVSGVGFVDFWIVMVLLGYALVTFTFRAGLGPLWRERDPLSILFGFAGRVAPLKLRDSGLYRQSPVAELSPDEPMPAALFSSVFVLLAATTFDNVSETVGWGSFLTSTGLADLPSTIVDSLALALFAGLFIIPFLVAIKVARVWMKGAGTLRESALRIGWSLIPIGVAYVLAHNAGLVLTGVPEMIRLLSDPFGWGWNMLGTAHLFEGYVVSPALVWFIEIALIVGGHILGVLAAHRLAIRAAGTHGEAVRSEYVLTALMCVFTISTLWLLAQPLVSS